MWGNKKHIMKMVIKSKNKPLLKLDYAAIFMTLKKSVQIYSRNVQLWAKLIDLIRSL